MTAASRWGPRPSSSRKRRRHSCGLSCRRRTAGYWAGSGNEGKVYRVDRAGKLTEFFDAPELEVHALAPAPGGGLFVGTSPDGKVYRLDSAGKSEILFDPEDKYIWSLAADRDGSVYVGTGDKGVIYRVAPDGKATPHYRTRSAHVLSLALDPGGRLIAGTESPGRVFRLDRDGKPFVLLDSPFREIRAIRFAPDGTLYVVAVSGRPGPTERPADRPPESPRAPVPTVSTEITSITLIESGAQPEDTGTRQEPRRTARGAVYRILPDGLWDLYWESPDDAPYDVSVEAGGSLLVATGSSGKLFRLAGDPIRSTLVARADAQQITWLIREPDGRHVYATSNPGKVFRLSRDRARRGDVRVGRAGRRDRGLVGSDPVARGAERRADRDRHAVGQHGDARRHVEPLVRGVRERRRRSDREPEGALPAVARGADRG